MPKFGPLQWMKHFLQRNPWLWPRGNAEVNFFFFWFFSFLSNEIFSLFFLPVVFVSQNWMQPTGPRLCSLPFLHGTTVTTAQRVLCKAAIVWGWCSLRVLVQYTSSCLGPWPPFLSCFEKPCSAVARENKMPCKPRGGGGKQLQRKSVYPRHMDQKPK